MRAERREGNARTKFATRGFASTEIVLVLVGVAGIVSVVGAAANGSWGRFGAAATPEPAAPAYALAVSDDGRRIVAGVHDRHVAVWDALNGECLASLQGHGAALTAVAISADGSRVFTACAYGRLCAWDLSSAASDPICIQAATTAIRTLALSPDGKLIATGTCEGAIDLRETSGLSRVRPCGTPGPGVRCVAFSPDGRLLTSAACDGSVSVWDVAQGSRLLRLAAHPSEWIEQVAFSPNGNEVISADQAGLVRIWSVAGGDEIRQFSHGGPLCGLSISPDGTQIVTSGWDARLRVWDVRLGEAAIDLLGHAGAVRRVQFSRDNQRVFSAGWDGTVREWNLARRAEVRQFEPTR